MKAKKVMMTVLAAVSVLSMSANVMAAGSITNAVDTNKVTASTVTKKIVGDKTEIATEDVDVKLEEVEADTFETDILNQSDADTIVESAFETVFGVENIPQVDFYEAAELTQENMDLSEFKFLSPVMNLIIIDRTLDRMTCFQFLQVLDHQLGIKGIGMIIVQTRSLFIRHIVMSLIIIVMLQDRHMFLKL